MPSVSLSFKVHIPYRLKQINPGGGSCCDYFDMIATKSIVNKFADECYLPANTILLSQIRELKGKCKIAFSVSGTAIELFREFRPDVIHSFKKLVKTGCVEFYAEPFYNSLSWLYSRSEFERQVRQHHELVIEVFDLAPRVFRNTELIYSNELAGFMADMGYSGILCDGLQRILSGRTAGQVYAPPGNLGFGLLLRHGQLSDDIAFRFDDPEWNEQPLTTEKFAAWLHGQESSTCITNLFFDYETFGIHKKAGCGIFDFLQHLPAAIIGNDDWKFVTPSEALDIHYPKDIYDVPRTISWEDKGKECCVWSENTRQHNTIRKIYDIESMVRQSNMPEALECWGRLQSADHFYYMCNDGRDPNDPYRALNPFESPQAAYENYRNAVMDLEIRLIQLGLKDIRKNSYREQRAASLYSSIY